MTPTTRSVGKYWAVRSEKVTRLVEDDKRPANMQSCERGERRAGVVTVRRKLGGREDVMSKSAMTCAILLMASGFVHLAWAQEKVDTESPVRPNFSFPAGAEI